MCAFVFQEHQGKALSDPWGWSGEVVWTEKHGVHDWWGLQSKGRERASPVPTLAGLQIVYNINHFIISLPSLTLFLSLSPSPPAVLTFPAHTLPPLLSHFIPPRTFHSSLTSYLLAPSIPLSYPLPLRLFMVISPTRWTISAGWPLRFWPRTCLATLTSQTSTALVLQHWSWPQGKHPLLAYQSQRYSWLYQVSCQDINKAVYIMLA